MPSLSRIQTPALGNSGAELGMRNRIINGDMRIDQRNAGALVISSTSAFACDRWRAYNSGAGGTWTLQQSSDAPVGFSSSMVATITSAGIPGESGIVQYIEGYNCADFGYGTANAKPITISFWVKSSVTGNFPFILRTTGGARSYLTTYNISAANTWEYKTITIPGETSGSINTANSYALILEWSLGGSVNATSVTNAWLSANNYNLTGSVQLMSTNGATLYITGVQLEKGSQATPFEFRHYGAELALCQRYYEVIGGSSNVFPLVTTWAADASGTTDTLMVFKVTKRAAPTVSLVGAWGGSGWTSLTPRFISEQGFSILTQGSGQTLVQYHPNTSDDKITASAEL